jgi:hypothetical protein
MALACKPRRFEFSKILTSSLAYIIINFAEPSD